MTRRARKIAFVGVILVESAGATLSGAHAQEIGFYAGPSDLAHADIRVANKSLTAAGLTNRATMKDSSETGYKLFAGYQFNPNLAVEAGYAVLGDFGFTSAVAPSGTAKITSMEPKAWNFDAIGSLALPHGFSLFARAGLVRTETKVTVEHTGTTAVSRSHFKDSDVGYHAGLGAGFAFNKNLDFRIEWERYRVPDGIADTANVDLFSWGLRVHF